MKVFNAIVKIFVALAAVAGAIYVAATYGDKIVAWCKKMIGCCCEQNTCEISDEAEVDAVAEEAPAEETEEAPAAAETEEGAVQAEETDFQ